MSDPQIVPKKAVIALVSGGKDSTLAVELALESGIAVSNLFTMIPKRTDSYMFHTPALNIMPLFAEAIGQPLITAPTSGDPENEIDDLLEALRPLSPKMLIAGAIASEYQYSRIQKICQILQCNGFFPLWHKSPWEILDLLQNRNYTIVFTGVSAMGLDQSWLGRLFDHQAKKELRTLWGKYGVHPAGEGGEFETLVLDAPFFKSKIVLDSIEKEWDGTAGRLIIHKSHLELKK